MADSARPQRSDATTTVEQLRHTMREFISQRRWEVFHNAKNLSMSLAIEAGELMEHFQWLRTEEVEAGQGFDRSAVADEMADVACYLLSLANALDLDLTAAIEQKMVKNRLKYPADG
jgi:dCTP diphosphatase